MYSNRVVFDETLLPKKSTNGRYVRFGASSGDKPGITPTSPIVQVIQWNNIQSTARRNIMKNFRLNGKLVVHLKTSATATKHTLKLIGDLNRFIDINCTVNGTCNYVSHGNATEPVYKNYIDGEITNMDVQTYYNLSGAKIGSTSQTTLSWALTSSATNQVLEWEIDFSTKIMHPFLFTELGGVSALNITITTNPGLLGMLDITSSETTLSEVNAFINGASISYVEYEGASDTFVKKVGYMVPYQVACAGSNEATANTRNVSGAPLNVYNHIGIEGSGLSTWSADIVVQKALPITVFNASVNNHVNCYNATGIQELFGRSKEMGYIGQMSDFTNSPVNEGNLGNNELGCCVKMSNRNLDVNINTGEIYRFDANITYNHLGKDRSKLYLYTIYEYPALLYLSPEKSTCEYIVNEPVSEVGDYEEDDLYSGAGLFDWIKKGFNWLKNNKILSRGATALSGILPGQAGTVASVVGDVANRLGMSTSVF